MSWRVCSTPGCPNLIETPARKCDACTRAQRDRTRTRGHNPYGTKGHQSFRRQVLARDPYCTCPRRLRTRRLRQTPRTLRQSKHNRRPLPIRKNRTHRHATQPQRPEVRTRPMQTMPRCKNRQNKTSRLQHQTINRNTVHHDKNSRQHPRGGGVTTTPLGPPVSCLPGAQGSNIADGPPRGRSRRSVARAQCHDER